MTSHKHLRLENLSPADSQWLAHEAQRVLAELGIHDTTTDERGLVVVGDLKVGLSNLARTLPLYPRRQWPRRVRDQLKTLMAMRPGSPARPEQLRTRLLPVEDLGTFLSYTPLEPLPGIAAVLTAQGKDASLVLGEVPPPGDRDQAYEAALTNLAALPRPRHERRRIDTREPSSWVEYLTCDDAHSASRVLVLPDLLRRLCIDFPAHGVLVTVPTKHDLWVHVPVDEGVMMTAVAMAAEAYLTHLEMPYPISPNVFLVSPDMHADVLIRPDREGLDLHQVVMQRLLAGVTGEASDRTRSS